MPYITISLKGGTLVNVFHCGGYAVTHHVAYFNETYIHMDYINKIVLCVEPGTEEILFKRD